MDGDETLKQIQAKAAHHMLNAEIRGELSTAGRPVVAFAAGAPAFAAYPRRMMSNKKRVFISFDFDNDADLKTLLVGQAQNDDTPFELADWSIKEPLTGDWQRKARVRIRATHLMIVFCGQKTDTATGVSAELAIAQQELVPYFLLAGYADKVCQKPRAARDSDKVYRWTWDNLKNLVGGAR